MAEQEDICTKCGNRPYISKCIWKTEEVMTECENFKKEIGSAY
jgi:hypothetical protein